MLNMGAVKAFDVFLDDPVEVYHVGETITGHVVVCLTKDLAMRGIRVVLRGEGRVHWREKIPTMQDKKRSTSFHGTELFLNERQTVWGREINEGGEIPLLNAGQHSFPFLFQFPNDPNLPCSFECGKIASIRYYIQANIDISWAVDPVAERYFSFVGSPIDCNLPRYQKTVHAADRKTLCCCCCCARGPIALKVELQRTAYCPGEYVNISTQLDNNSDKAMTLGVKLVQSVTIQAEIPKRASKSGSYEILTYTSPSVLPNQEYILQTARMIQIPVLPPSITSHVVQVNYVIEVCLMVDEKNELEIYFPITIGNVPYIEQKQNVKSKAVTYAHSAPSSCGANTDDIHYDDGETVTQLKPFSPLYVTLTNVPLSYSCNGTSTVKLNQEAVSERQITRINSRDRDGVVIRVNSRQEYGAMTKVRTFHSNSNSSTVTGSSSLTDTTGNGISPGSDRTQTDVFKKKRYGIVSPSDTTMAPSLLGNGFAVPVETQARNVDEIELLRRSQCDLCGINFNTSEMRKDPVVYDRSGRLNKENAYRISGQYV
ncbi:arrestin domain-containing protein 2-like [Ptychodera flava]|uniref:arrestin domain-containing protein 2-like n=1 Tax=Ptychodera flava TaxID=63121 RepID=UPI003969E0A6